MTNHTMTVTKATDGRYNTLSGTLAEVRGALDAEHVPSHKVIAFMVDAAGTAYVALYHR